MAPISKRALVVFVLIAAALSCGATVSGSELGARSPSAVVVIERIGVVRVSTEGYLEERLVLPRKLAHELRRAGIRIDLSYELRGPGGQLAFCLDENHAVGAAAPVDGCRTRVLQDCDRLDNVGIDSGKGASRLKHHAV